MVIEDTCERASGLALSPTGRSVRGKGWVSDIIPKATLTSSPNRGESPALSPRPSRQGRRRSRVAWTSLAPRFGLSSRARRRLKPQRSPRPPILGTTTARDVTGFPRLAVSAVANHDTPQAWHRDSSGKPNGRVKVQTARSEAGPAPYPSGPRLDIDGGFTIRIRSEPPDRMWLESFLTAYGGLVGVFVGVGGGGLIAYLLYSAARPTKQVSYTVWTENLVRKLSSWVSDLELRYRGEPIKAAPVSKVVIWNSGHRELKRDDVAPTDRLRVTVQQPVRILSISVIGASNAANNSRLQGGASDGTQVVDFDYLNRNDGLAIQIVHTGTESSSLAIQGEIIGGEPVRRDDPWRRWVPFLPLGILVVMALALVGLLQRGSPIFVYATLPLAVIAIASFLLLATGRPKRVLLKPHPSLAQYVRPFLSDTPTSVASTASAAQAVSPQE